MKIISFEDIRSLNISPRQCYEWVSEMISTKDETILPAKTHINLPGNIFCNIMPSICQTQKTGGVKIVTRYPLRKPSLDSKILIFNSETGEFLALMDGNWITAMRTGAVAAHSISLFAKNNYQTLGIIGLGNTARASMLVLEAITQRTLKVKLLRYKDQAEQFMKRFEKYDNLQFSIYDSAEQVVSGSDIVLSCATYFENDICDDKCFDEGVLVVPVHTRGFTNCDLFFDKVYADDTGHVDHFKNFNKFRKYAEVSDVVNGIAIGRENEKERIITYNIGVSIHDINYAFHIYQKFLCDPKLFNTLKDAELCDPTKKFWV